MSNSNKSSNSKHSHDALPVLGIKLGSADSNSKYKDRNDLVLMQIESGASIAAVFTRNLFCAAPVIVAKENLQKAVPKFLLINAGNANAGTGEQGLDSARSLCLAVAEAAACNGDEVLPFSTGVIGEQLALEKLAGVIPVAYQNLSAKGWETAAKSILTTDLVAKTASARITMDDKPVTITGMCKGSGMIHPDMATMLAYIGTDVCIAPELMQGLLKTVVDQSFNCITVDGDTSTNDACVLIATQQAGNKAITNMDSAPAQLFTRALKEVFVSLAQQIVRDGEGATKFITLKVSGAADNNDAKIVALTVAHSPLVKTALFASDPNWGRILAAVGRAPVVSLNISTIDIALGGVLVINNGVPAIGYSEEKGAEVFSREEITIDIKLGDGNGVATVWTTDLSYDYIKINAEYRS